MSETNGALDHAFNDMDVGYEAVWKHSDDATPADAFAAALENIDRNPYHAKTEYDEDGHVEQRHSVWQILPDGVDIQNAKYRFENRENLLSGAKERREVYTHVAILLLESNGQLFSDQDDRLWYFYKPESEVYRIDGQGNQYVTSEFRALLRSLTGMSPDKDGRVGYANIRDYTLRECPTREAFDFATWDDDDGVLYVTDFDGGYYRLDGDTIQYRENGRDVFFLSNEEGDPYTYLPADERPELDDIAGEMDAVEGEGDLIKRMFPNRMSPDPNQHMTPEQQRTQLYIQIHLFPLIDYFTGKPILAFVGKKGSGKTALMRSIGKFVYGDGWDETGMDEDRKEFINTLTNNTLAFIDNWDDGHRWANDVLASTATGSAVSFRELYTTNEQRKVKPRCFIGMTSRDAPFRRDDIADRLLVFRLQRLSEAYGVERGEGSFVGMAGFLGEVTENRDTLWSAYLDNINAIVNELQDTDISNYRSSHRMADWAALSQVVSDALDVDGVDDLLDAMEEERSFFAVEDDPLYPVLQGWLDENGTSVRGKRFSAGDLLSELEDYSEKLDVEWTYNSSKSLGKRLSHISTELDNIFGFNVEQHDGQNKYVFPEQSTGQTGLDSHNTAKSQSERYEAVKTFIREHDEDFSDGIPREVICSMLDFHEEKVSKIVDKLTERGVIMEPAPGHFRYND